MIEPKLIRGGLSLDDRGLLRHVNEFDFPGVKRFYQVENHNNDIIRAFHGHLKEQKYVYVASGTILMLLVHLDNTVKPDKNARPERYVLSADAPSILHIPAGYANGFKSLSKLSRVIFYSTKSLADSEQNDDYRFPYDYWGVGVWKVENR